MNVSIRTDHKTKSFHLSAPVYLGTAQLPQSIAQFFNSLSQEKNRGISLQGKIPFSWGYQPTLRQRFYEFARKAKEHRKFFKYIEICERLRNIDSILDS